MADATTTARDRIDRALALLERKVLDLKARPALARAPAEDDLFAIPMPAPPEDPGRIGDLEAAGREASAALAAAAAALQQILAEDAPDTEGAG